MLLPTLALPLVAADLDAAHAAAAADVAFLAPRDAVSRLDAQVADLLDAAFPDDPTRVAAARAALSPRAAAPGSVSLARWRDTLVAAVAVLTVAVGAPAEAWAAA